MKKNLLVNADSIRVDAQRASLLQEFLESISQKIDDNSDHPEAIRALKELGREYLAQVQGIDGITPIPDWRPAFIEKFGPEQ